MKSCNICRTRLTLPASDLAYQGQEKTMFYRICRLLTLNVQLIFVFDGPGRPWKHGGRGRGKIDYRARDLLKEVLTCFGIPYHEAPGEAEAECARLQILGIVDAVWSQDSDCLMFGCTLWLRDDRVVKEKGTKDRSKENTQKSKKTALVVKANDLKKIYIDREALILFAMLVGGDYDPKGLPGCGPRMAMKAIRRGLGQSLCACQNQRDCDTWHLQFSEFLQTSGARGLEAPIGFPAFKTLVKYNCPKVSSNEALMSNSKLKLEYVRPIDELKLLEVTSSRFNIWGRLYLNWVGPVLLTRSLAYKSSHLPREVVHSIRFTKQRAKADVSALSAHAFERKISFSPFGITTLRREDFEGMRLGYWNGDRTTLFDPEHRVECELPFYWLQKVIPQHVLEPSPPNSKQRKPTPRKQQVEMSELSESPVIAKRKRQASKDKLTAVTSLASTSEDHLYMTPSKKRPCKLLAGHMENIIELSDSDEELHLPLSRLPVKSSAPCAISQVVDFGSPSSSEGEFVAAADTRGNQNPSIISRSGFHAKTSLSVLTETEEREVQQALRLSMHEHITLPLSPQKRSSAGLKSPQTLTDCDSRNKKLDFTACTPKAARSTLSETSPTALDYLKDVSSRAMNVSAGPDRTVAQQPQCESLQSASKANVASTILPVSLAPRNVRDIRRARIQRFAPPTASPSTNYPPKTTATRVNSESQAQYVFRVPAGADCIDLTNDLA
jgi:Holliday junction resolvase YEN1